MGRNDSGPIDQLLAQAAFPLVAYPWPHRKDYTSLVSYMNSVKGRARDWVYHLAVYRSADGPVSHLPRYDTGRMVRQAEALNRFTGLSTPAGLVLRAQEYIVNRFDPDEASDWVLGQPEIFEGESHGLAISMLLLAASHMKPLPPWAVFSGRVPDGTTRVAGIGQLVEKIDIIAGEIPRAQPIRETVKKMYQDRATPDRLGPESLRTIPGQVHLMVVPRETLDRALGRGDLTSCDVEDVSEDFALRLRGLRELASLTPEERKECFRAEAGGGVVLVGVDDVFQAGALVGLPQPEPAADLGLTAVRVRALVRTKPPIGAGGPGELIRSYREEIGRWLLALRMHFDRDDEIGLTLDVALLDPNAEPRRLRLFASYGARAGAIPGEYPGDVGLIDEAIETGETVVEPRLSQNPGHLVTLGSRNRIARRHRDLDVAGYIDFLAEARSCVIVPMKNNDLPIGVLALHGDREFKIDGDGRAILERFARDLFATRVDFARESMRVPERRSAIQHDLEKAIGRKPLPKDYVEHVESLIRQHFGASRASLRLLYPAKDVLAPPFDPKPEGSPRREIQLSDDTAASFAVRIAQSYPIRDVSEPLVQNPANGQMEPIHYHRDPGVKSHYALVLKEGSHILGVISISWRRPNAFTERDVRDLEFLASEVTPPIKWLKTTTERLLELEQMLKLPAPGRDRRSRFPKTIEACASPWSPR